MKKRKELNKKNSTSVLVIANIVVILCVVLLSIGYSVYQVSLDMSNSLAFICTEKEIARLEICNS